jgi:DNA-binding CsgD family transcriptional regulator
MDTLGRLVAADERARLLFSHLRRFDTRTGNGARNCEVDDALGYIARILNEIFHLEAPIASPAPVVRLYSHWSGIALRLRGVLTPGVDTKDYFTVIVEAGEMEEHRQRRLMYRRGVSRRESEILTALADGKLPREMAAQMGLQSDTVKSYLRRLTDKLDLADIAALRSFARRNFRGD